MNDVRRGDPRAKRKSRAARLLPGRPSEHLIESFLERPDRHTKHGGHRERDTPILKMAKARPRSIEPSSAFRKTLVAAWWSSAMVSGPRSHSGVGAVQAKLPCHAARKIKRTRNVNKLTMVAILNIGFRNVNYGLCANHNQSFRL